MFNSVIKVYNIQHIDSLCSCVFVSVCIKSNWYIYLWEFVNVCVYICLARVSLCSVCVDPCLNSCGKYISAQCACAWWRRGGEVRGGGRLIIHCPPPPPPQRSGVLLVGYCLQSDIKTTFTLIFFPPGWNSSLSELRDSVSQVLI